MATPNYTGVIALMLSENLDKPNYYKTVNARTMSTATQYVDKELKNTSFIQRLRGLAITSEPNINKKEITGDAIAKLNNVIKEHHLLE